MSIIEYRKYITEQINCLSRRTIIELIQEYAVAKFDDEGVYEIGDPRYKPIEIWPQDLGLPITTSALHDVVDYMRQMGIPIDKERAIYIGQGRDICASDQVKEEEYRSAARIPGELACLR